MKSTLFLALIFIATPAFAIKNSALSKLPAKVEQTVLGDSVVEKLNNQTTIKFDLGIKPSWKQPVFEDHGSFLQLKLPETIVSNPGRFYDVDSKYISKIATFQFTPSEGAIRVFTKKSAARTLPATKATIEGTSLHLNLDHKLITPENIQAKEAPKSLAALGTKKTPKKEGLNLASADRLQLESKMMNATIFVGIMLMTWLAIMWFKPKRKFRRKKSNNLPAEEPLAINTLTSTSVSAKHKLSLVEVAGEKLLLSIGPEGVFSFKNHWRSPCASTSGSRICSSICKSTNSTQPSSTKGKTRRTSPPTVSDQEKAYT